MRLEAELAVLVKKVPYWATCQSQSRMKLCAATE